MNADLIRFANSVLDVLSIQDGTTEVFGRTLDLSDAGALELIREAARELRR